MAIGPFAAGGWTLGSHRSGGPRHSREWAFRLLRSLRRRWCYQEAFNEELTDRLHDGRTAYVFAEDIVSTFSAWLAELGARSPFVEDLARAVRSGDWVTAHSIADRLSVDVAVAA